MLPWDLVGNPDNLVDSLGTLGSQAVQDKQAAEDSQAAQDNQVELGSLVTCQLLHPPGLEDGLLGEHLHRVVVDLGKTLVVDSSHNPAQEEGTGVELMDLADQGMVEVHMQEAWDLDRQ